MRRVGKVWRAVAAEMAALSGVGDHDGLGCIRLFNSRMEAVSMVQMCVRAMGGLWREKKGRLMQRGRRSLPSLWSTRQMRRVRGR